MAGPPRGQTPKEVVLSRGTLSLYHYTPMTDEVYRTPILFVMATTNRAYVFDLAPGQSFVEFMLKRGYDIYVIDWNPPQSDEARLGFEDYILEFIPSCVSEVQTRSGEEVSVIGYCMGGVLSLMYTALHTPGPVRNLAVFTTPFNWREFGLFNTWSDTRHFDVDTLVDSLGNVPPEIILASFDMLRPSTKIASQIQLWDNIWNDEFVKSYRAIDRWGNETLSLPGEYFRQTIKELMNGNKLYTGELEIGGRKVTWATSGPRSCTPSPSTTTSSPTPAAAIWWTGRLGRQGGGCDERRPCQPDRRRQRCAPTLAEARPVALGAIRVNDIAKRRLPRSLDLDGEAIELRSMTGADEAAVLAFAKAAPAHDLLFLARDITHPKAVKAWVRDIEAGSISTVLAWRGDTIVGCAAIIRDPLSWSGHVAEMRVLLDSMPARVSGVAHRGSLRYRAGPRGEKITARITLDQKGAIAVFEGLGFTLEAMLRDQVKGRDGRKHDVLILSHDVRA